MSKPVGIYWGPNLPKWASFAFVPDWATDDELRACADEYDARGVQWILYFGRDSFDDEISDTVREMRARCDRVGLTPGIVGATYHEEPYAQLAAGAFTRSLRWGRFDPSIETHHHAGVASLRAWWSAQHAAILGSFPGVQILFVENFFHESDALGARLWRPIPDHTTVLGAECYVTAGASWDAVTHLVPGITAPMDLVLTVAATYRPLMLIVQGFATAQGDWVGCPASETLRRTAGWMAHPQVKGACVFNRPAIDAPGFMPFEALPNRRDIERALGVAA